MQENAQSRCCEIICLAKFESVNLAGGISFEITD